jgi:Flp pilus assembly pilin Flp
MRATIGRFTVLRRLGLDRRGATAIEYALIAGGVSIVIAVGVTSIGNSLKTLYFDKIAAMF